LPHVIRAAVMLMSFCLLLYTGVVVPIQVGLWDYDSPCNIFPTLYFDVFVDIFFLVRQTSS
jgi:hypothetical protein